MKKGFFTILKPNFPVIICLFLSLPGCASFLELGHGEDDPAEYDRGYNTDEAEEDQAANTEANGDRDLASSAFDDTNYEQRRIKRAIEMRDVVLGMSRHEVAESWGQPAQREVAGRSGGGHERWIYGSRFSLSGPRTVIFENGRVAGWSH
ncbi:MAG TPA: hypothetical protein VIH99_05210 [Bdellovibrionota bacterium]|jgi:hypothetical protein